VAELTAISNYIRDEKIDIKEKKKKFFFFLSRATPLHLFPQAEFAYQNVKLY